MIPEAAMREDLAAFVRDERRIAIWRTGAIWACQARAPHPEGCEICIYEALLAAREAQLAEATREREAHGQGYDALCVQLAEKDATTWTCFHCTETFTDEAAAREHFGASEMDRTGCQLKAEEGGLLAALRKAEAELASYRSEDTEKDRAYYRMQSEHAVALRQEEEKGYARGLRDYTALESRLTQAEVDQQIATNALVEEIDLRVKAEATLARVRELPNEWAALSKAGQVGGFVECAERLRRALIGEETP